MADLWVCMPHSDDHTPVVLVDAQDNALGTMGKMEAHEKGMLHRAFSIFLFNRHGQLLMQQRASGKYQSALLWTNTCCSHPLPGEPVLAGAGRRLNEELGIQAELRHQFTFIYRAHVGQLIEHELDHVLFGQWDLPLRPNPTEVAATRWMGVGALDAEIGTRPDAFTPWFLACWHQVRKRWPRRAQGLDALGG